MSTAFNLGMSFSGAGVYSDGAGLSDLVAPTLNFPAFDFSGAQSGAQVWQQVVLSLAVAAGTPQDLDLSGSLLTKEGVAFSPAKLFLAALILATPDGTKQIQFGPLSQANPAQLWFGATSGSEIVLYSTLHWNLNPGWTITPATGDKLRVQNPGSGTTNCFLWLVGQQ